MRHQIVHHLAMQDRPIDMARQLTLAPLAPLLMTMAFVVSPAGAFGGVGARESYHLHFYMHDFSNGPNASAIMVAHGTGPLLGGSKDRRFGDVVVMDDTLTEGPNTTSRALGRAQGFYIVSSSISGDPTLHISMDLVVTSGPYNGSTLAVTAATTSWRRCGSSQWSAAWGGSGWQRGTC